MKYFYIGELSPAWNIIVIHHADISRGQPSSDDRPLLSFFKCSRSGGIGQLILRLQKPSADIADLDDFPKMIESHLDRPLHAGRGVDPLPCDVLHRTVLLQRWVAVKHEGVALVT